MRRQYREVQIRLLQINTGKLFVPCGCHSLNLIVSDAAVPSSAQKFSSSCYGTETPVTCTGWECKASKHVSD
jgi:hypothetical protein